MKSQVLTQRHLSLRVFEQKVCVTSGQCFRVEQLCTHLLKDVEGGTGGRVTDKEQGSDKR
jgi:hypothetical protein